MTDGSIKYKIIDLKLDMTITLWNLTKKNIQIDHAHIHFLNIKPFYS